MWNAIAHYLLIPVKIIAIWGISTWHKIKLSRELKVTSKFIDLPIKTRLIRDQEEIDWESHVKITNKGPYYNINADHQALRHGSLAWGSGSPALINGVENFIDSEHNFVRGVTSTGLRYNTVPPAMGMSVAFTIAKGLKEQVDIRDSLKFNYLKAVDKLIKNDFRQGSDTNTIPRAKSTAFDAIFAASLLSTAYKLSKDSKYKKELNEILWKKGYAFMMMAPITYWKKRNYFIDHISMFGLWTIFQTADSKVLKWLCKRAMKFVSSQSYLYGNPYFAALQKECECLPEEQRQRVLHYHANTDVKKACEHRLKNYRLENYFDWGTTGYNEFLFDDIPRGGNGSDAGALIHMVPVNGICLAKSLLLLEDTLRKSQI